MLNFLLIPIWTHPNSRKMSGLMDKFEHQFADLDVQSAVMEKTMGGSVASMTPLSSVEALMEEVCQLLY